MLLLSMVAVAVGIVLTVPQARTQADAVWHRAVAWAGFADEAGDSGVVYWCPMHPQIKRNDPNDVCPICNMALVPLVGGGLEAPEHLTLTSRQIQQAGVATEPVLRRKLHREIDTTGRIAADERREAKITSWIRGKSRIEKLYVNFTGAHVQQGDVIAELYSPELIVAQQEFLMARDTSTSRLSGVDLRKYASQKLRDQGMTQEQIDRLVQTQEVLERVPVHAPLTGTVLERHVQQGEYIEEGETLFQIVNLEEVWLLADIYEEELPLVDMGQQVTVTVPSFPGESFEGVVSFVDPTVQLESRTVRVRIEIPNSDGRLKPRMYARAQFRAELPQTLAVSENAVLWSGQRQVAVVKLGEGAFEPREIEIGLRWLYPSTSEAAYQPGAELQFGSDFKRYHHVLSGLSPGEEVVTAGAFLLSAESQFQSVLTKMLPPEERSATLEEAIGEELAKDIRQLLNRYFHLSQALAGDKLDEAVAAFAALGEAASTLAVQAHENQVPELTVLSERIARQADEIGNQPPADLKEARFHFGRISRQMVQLLAENGGQTLFGEDVFLFRCGMSKVGYENWLWWSEEKLNPYMGQKMLTCGSQLDVLEP
ncbi:efflux RND transporter periplasmic adaptor subunit [Candidatus Laterigemmans baculatus]|uniref:efflux RND transporter periplasmic adaptor subunit n=2 Tax=Candidatus Laterigemmans baculatus TaxID=2770505 RepID=UPI00193C4D96|nr:efflux RND transporter periplasmic adaptor subunit [Candidatus Laterigemmans baculatus]